MTTANQVGKAVGQAVKNVAEKSKKVSPAFASKAEKIGVFITILLLVLPAMFLLVRFIAGEISKGRKGLKMPAGKGWLVSIETDGLRVDGEELLECAHEGARARVKAKKEKAEAEFSRAVAAEVKKAMQGHAKA